MTREILLTDDKYDMLDLCKLAKEYQTMIEIEITMDGVRIEITPWGDDNEH